MNYLLWVCMQCWHRARKGISGETMGASSWEPHSRLLQHQQVIPSTLCQHTGVLCSDRAPATTRSLHQLPKGVMFLTSLKVIPLAGCVSEHKAHLCIASVALQGMST